MKKKIIIGLVIVLFLLLVPFVYRYKDGGTKKYKSLLYTITDYHILDDRYEDGFDDSFEIKILGIPIYKKVDARDVEEKDTNYKNEDDNNGDDVVNKSQRRIVRVNGNLYYDTGRESHELRCGVMDGKIESHVIFSEIPSEDNQSNFEGDYDYQFGILDTIEVNIDGKFIVFERID